MHLNGSLIMYGSNIFIQNFPSRPRVVCNKNNVNWKCLIVLLRRQSRLFAIIGVKKPGSEEVENVFKLPTSA